MYYPVCGMMHLIDPLLLIGKSNPCSGDSKLPFSLYEWSFTVYLMPYNCKQNLLSASLNTKCPSLFIVLFECQAYLMFAGTGTDGTATEPYRHPDRDP